MDIEAMWRVKPPVFGHVCGPAGRVFFSGMLLGGEYIHYHHHTYLVSVYAFPSVRRCYFFWVLSQLTQLSAMVHSLLTLFACTRGSSLSTCFARHVRTIFRRFRNDMIGPGFVKATVELAITNVCISLIVRVAGGQLSVVPNSSVSDVWYLSALVLALISILRRGSVSEQIINSGDC